MSVCVVPRERCCGYFGLEASFQRFSKARFLLNKLSSYKLGLYT